MDRPETTTCVNGNGASTPVPTCKTGVSSKATHMVVVTPESSAASKECHKRLISKEKLGRALGSVTLSNPLLLSGVPLVAPSPAHLPFSSLSVDYDSPHCKSSSQIRLQRLHRTKRKQTVVNKYCEEMNDLNEAANGRPRNALIHSIQQENRHIRELQRENKELRLALEEHQNIMELIMSKYRQQIAKLVSVNSGQNLINNSTEHAKMASQMEKISEMVAVMRKAASLGEDEYCDQQRAISTLAVENKGLREMLQIAHKSGSIPSAVVSDAHTQTDSVEIARDDLSPELDSPNRSPGSMNGLHLQS